VKNITGQIVIGDDFFGRTKEREEGWELIKKRTSLILADSRRVGKSSFAYKMRERAEQEKWNYVFCNMQGCRNEEALYNKFITELERNSQYKKIGKKWKLEEIEVSPEAMTFRAVALKWKRQSKSNNIYNNLEEILDHTKDTLIVFDELIIFLNKLKGENNERLKDAVLFLDWLEAIRNVPNSKIRWILCSSLSIDKFLLDHKIEGKMKGMHRFLIGELKDGEPTGFIDALAKSKNLIFSEESKQYTLDKLGWHLPYFIQLLFSKLPKSDKNIHISTETIEKAYQELLAEAEKQKHFITWVRHLDTYSKDEGKCAHIILKELSTRQQGGSKNALELWILSVIRGKDVDEIVKDLLEKLEQGGYIIQNENKKYLFRSPLLRDFWCNKFVKK